MTPSADAATGSAASSGSGPALVLESVSFTYPGAASPALEGVSLAVREGELFGLLGPNGAGKTTLISLVSGLLRPGAGRASLFGRTIGDPESKRSFGLCPQELALYPALTARENLILFGRLAGMTRAHLRERTDAVLASVGLGASADRLAGEFSGGMKRRLNLAIAVLHEPRLLLLDEPTAGVDPQSRNLIFDSLAALRAGGSTIVYTTHYLEEAERLCERIAIIDHGKLLVCAERDELMSGRVRLEERFLELTGRELRD
jgi:ABC-2 type transport system ATP-binding protein